MAIVRERTEKHVMYEFPKGTTIFFTDSMRWIATAAFKVIVGNGKKGRDLHAVRAQEDIHVYFDGKEGVIHPGIAFWIALKNGKRLRS